MKNPIDTVLNNFAKDGLDVEIKRKDKDGNMVSANANQLSSLKTKARIATTANVLNNLTQAQKTKWAIAVKNEANYLYAQGLFQQAMDNYVEALTAADFGAGAKEQPPRPSPPSSPAPPSVQPAPVSDPSLNCSSRSLSITNSKESDITSNISKAGQSGALRIPDGGAVGEMITKNDSTVVNQGPKLYARGESYRGRYEEDYKNKEKGEEEILLTDSRSGERAEIFNGDRKEEQQEVSDWEKRGEREEKVVEEEDKYDRDDDSSSDGENHGDGDSDGDDDSYCDDDLATESRSDDESDSVDETKNNNNNIDELVVPVLCNLAACCIQLGEWSKAAAFSHQALTLRPLCLKASLRCGIAMLRLQEYNQALEKFRFVTSEIHRQEEEEQQQQKQRQQVAESTRQSFSGLSSKDVQRLPALMREAKLGLKHDKDRKHAMQHTLARAFQLSTYSEDLPLLQNNNNNNNNSSSNSTAISSSSGSKELIVVSECRKICSQGKASGGYGNRDKKTRFEKPIGEGDKPRSNEEEEEEEEYLEGPYALKYIEGYKRLHREQSKDDDNKATRRNHTNLLLDDANSLGKLPKYPYYVTKSGKKVQIVNMPSSPMWTEKMQECEVAEGESRRDRGIEKSVVDQTAPQTITRTTTTTRAVMEKETEDKTREKETEREEVGELMSLLEFLHFISWSLVRLMASALLFILRLLVPKRSGSSRERRENGSSDGSKNNSRALLLKRQGSQTGGARERKKNR